MKLAGFALRNDKVIVFAVIVLALLGVRAYLITPQSIFPNMSFARIDVVADAGDLPPNQVRVGVTLPLEQAFQALPSVTQVYSTSSQGSSELVVTFSSTTDPQVDLQYVNAAISQTRSSIAAAKNVIAVIINPNSEPVLSYALTSGALSDAVLRQIAQFQIAPKLYGVAGLGRVLVAGGPTIEFHIDLDPSSLAAYGLGAGDVSRALADANNVQAVGVTQQFYQRYAIVIDSSLRDAASLGRVTVPLKAGGSVPIAALGRVVPGVSPEIVGTSINGQHAVVINAYALPGADTVKMATELRARLAQVNPTLPRDVKVTNFWDQTTLIVASQSALRDAIFIGAAIAIVVIYLFLRNLRLTLVAAAVIPIAMAIAVFALQMTGQTLNLMSVGGLAVAVGLIIDDAIVVIENIARNMRDHPGPKADVIERGMAQIGSAMIASTTTTVVVFLPLALLTGATGFFFRALAFTLSAALIVSLGLALFVAPILARTLLREGGEAPHRRDAIGAVLDRYDPLLRWALAHRTIVYVASAATLVVTFLLLSSLPSGFLPSMDEGQFEAAYALPTGTSLQASDAAGMMMERIVKGDPAVASVGRLTGIDSNGYSPTQVNQGLLRVRLKPPNERASYDVVSTRLRDRLNDAVPSSTFDFHQILEDIINDLSGVPAPIEITVNGPDQATLIRVATDVSSAISKVPGVVDAFNGVVYNSPSLRVQPRGAQLAAQSLTPSDIGDAVGALAQGTVATAIPGTNALVPVRVEIAGAASTTPDAIGSDPLLAHGAVTSLGALAALRPVRLDSNLNALNGQPVVRVTANISGANLSSVTAGIRHALASVSFPPGYAADIGGQAATQRQSFTEFLTVIAIAIALVFAVMLAAFRSFRLPLVILTAIPLALIGVALGLVVTGTPFNVSSFMGLLLLVGVVVKNGILLIDVANKERAAGSDVRDALLAAGKTRLRPIVMTTLAAIGGLLPLALGIGQGAEMEKPLAIAVIGGLSTATIFTLIVIPVLYAAFAGGSHEPRRLPAAAPALVVLIAVALTLVPRGAGAQTLTDQPANVATFSALSSSDAERAGVGTAPEVQAAAARLDQSRAALLLARTGAVPSFVSNYAQVPQGNPPGPNVTARSVTAELQWTIGDFLAFAPATREAALTLAAAEADYGAAQATERVKVVGLYYDALRARNVADARRSALQLAVAQRDAANVRANAGDAPRLDVVRADVAVARAQADLESAVALDQNASDALAVETGVPADALQSTVATTFVAINPALTNAAAVAELARARRPEIASARLTTQAADAGVRSARAAGFPLVTVNGGYMLGTDSGVPINAPTVGASVTIPLSNAAHQRVAIAAAKAAEARANATAVERSIVLAAEASARTLGAADRAAAATTRARSSADAELRATELGYRNGASSSLDVTTARATYVQAVVDEISARYDLEKARATLAIEVGG